MSSKDKISLVAILNASKAIKYDPNYSSKYFYSAADTTKSGESDPSQQIQLVDSNQVGSNENSSEQTFAMLQQNKTPTQQKGGIIVDEEDPNIVYVCGFTIDLNVVTKEEIMSLRKILPQKEYRLLKNRKSARICRARRKKERMGMADELKILKQKYAKLKAKVKTLEPSYISSSDEGENDLSDAETSKPQKKDIDGLVISQTILKEDEITSSNLDLVTHKQDSAHRERKISSASSAVDSNTSESSAKIDLRERYMGAPKDYAATSSKDEMAQQFFCEFDQYLPSVKVMDKQMMDLHNLNVNDDDDVRSVLSDLSASKFLM